MKNRPNFFELHNGSKVSLPFTNNEYENRLKILREIISQNNLDAVVFTSMQNIAYYSGFLYCSFGRPYA
jgi:creatinase